MRIRIFWIRISILKVGSGSVCRDTNPDPDPGNMQKHAMAKHSNCFLNLDLFFSLDPYGEFPDPDLNPQGDSRIQDPDPYNNSYGSASLIIRLSRSNILATPSSGFYYKSQCQVLQWLFIFSSKIVLTCDERVVCHTHPTHVIVPGCCHLT